MFYFLSFIFAANHPVITQRLTKVELYQQSRSGGKELALKFSRCDCWKDTSDQLVHNPNAPPFWDIMLCFVPRNQTGTVVPIDSFGYYTNACIYIGYTLRSEESVMEHTNLHAYPPKAMRDLSRCWINIDREGLSYRNQQDTINIYPEPEFKKILGNSTYHPLGKTWWLNEEQTGSREYVQDFLMLINSDSIMSGGLPTYKYRRSALSRCLNGNSFVFRLLYQLNLFKCKDNQNHKLLKAICVDFHFNDTTPFLFVPVCGIVELGILLTNAYVSPEQVIQCLDS